MSILDQIVAEKHREVARLVPAAAALELRALARTDVRDFAGALRGADGRPSLIAEVKKASPSAGVIRPQFDPVAIACAYAAAGASVLSVLTDETFFQGKLEYLEQIRAAVNPPVLRKDFLIDKVQVLEAAARGADAVLLIVAILEDHRLCALQSLATQLRLAVLVEVHDEGELDRALAADAAIIGINNRNLNDFSVDLAVTDRLAARLRGLGKLVVAESGIHTRADVDRVARAGVNAILVGESLMRSGDIAGTIRELMGA